MNSANKLAAVNSIAVNSIIEQYGFNSSESTVQPLGNGLINSTYLVAEITHVDASSINHQHINEKSKKKVVLQKINQSVFKQPLAIVNNAELISRYLVKQRSENGYPMHVLSQISTEAGANHVSKSGDIWRVLEYVDNCYTIEAIESAEQASQAAKAFAQFTSALADFDTSKLEEIIPDFHNLEVRIAQLNAAKEAALESNRKERLNTGASALAFCLSEQSFISEVAECAASLPLHVTHNDTKINNLLFCEKNHQAKAVIDLDTCMPGFLMNDFGDMVRTCCSNLPEDGTELDSMTVKIDVFEALASAYIKGFGDKITDIEKHSLIIGSMLLPFMIGVRFLTDYLNGDIYFHTQYPSHNLDRALNQFKLFSLLKEQREQLARIIQKY